MKIAVSASSPELDSSVDPRFGRCPYFLIVDPETMEFEAVENPYVRRIEKIEKGKGGKKK